MVYILVYSIEGKKDFEVVNNEKDLTTIIEKIEGIGKQKTITLYKAEQASYEYTLEDKERIVIDKIPKIKIL